MKKNIFLILMSFVMMLGGCGRTELKEAESYNSFSQETLCTSALTGGWNEEIAAYDEDICILLKNRIVGEPEEAVLENEFYSMQRETGTVEKLELEGIKTYSTVFSVTMPASGGLLVMDVLNGDMYRYDENYQMTRQANALDMDVYQKDEMNSEYGYGPSVWIESDSEYIYIYQEMTDCMKLDVLNPEMEVIYAQKEKIEDSAYIPCPNLSSNCLFARVQGEDVLFFQFNAEKQTMEEVKGKKIRGKAEFFENANKYCGDSLYDCYLYDNTSTPKTDYSYDLLGIKDGVFYKIVSFESMNMDGITPYFATDGNGGFLAEQYEILSDENVYVLLKPDDVGDGGNLKDGRIVACIAGAAEAEQLKKYASAFNGASDKYYIEIKDYESIHETYEDAVRAMNLDMINGEEIDGVNLYQTDRERLIANGYLAPLNDYLDKSAVLSEETIQDFVWKCMQEEDGRIYSVYPEFSLQGVLSKKKIDFSGLQEYADKQKSLFLKEKPEELLRKLLRFSGNRFVNEEKGTACFDEDFLALLECVKMNSGEAGAEDDYALQIVHGEAMAYYETIDFPYTYYFNEYLFDGEFVCGNYGTDGPVLVPGVLEMGVLASSDRKEAVYAFWDYMFEDANYNRNFGKIAFPILKSSWEEWEIRLTATAEYTDHYGETIYVRDFPYSAGGVDIVIPPMEQEDVGRMMEMMQQAVVVRPMRAEYLQIICEEAEGYFHGSKSPEEVRDNIDNRIQNALNE